MTGYEIFGLVLIALIASGIGYVAWRVAKSAWERE